MFVITSCLAIEDENADSDSVEQSIGNPVFEMEAGPDENADNSAAGTSTNESNVVAELILFSAMSAVGTVFQCMLSD